MKKWSFISIECILYLTFLWLDAFVPGGYEVSNHMKLVGIVLCFFYTLSYGEKEGSKRERYVLRGALFFTLVSDVCLLRYGYYEVGVSSFCLVQLFYWYRMNGYDGKAFSWKKNIGVLGCVGVLGLCFFLFRLPVDYTLLCGTVYIVLFVRNVFMVFRLSANWLFQVGLVLFLCCDINVGLYNMTSYVAFSGGSYERIYMLASFFMWFFYLPSQVMLCLSISKGDGK